MLQIFGNGHLTTQTMGYLLQKNIPVSFLSSRGRYNGYVLSLVNKNTIRPEDFEQTNKGIRFTKEALDRFLVGYYGRMQQTFQHPTRNKKTTYLRAIELQVRHLARVITGEDAAYKPFLVQY